MGIPEQTYGEALAALERPNVAGGCGLEKRSEQGDLVGMHFGTHIRVCSTSTGQMSRCSKNCFVTTGTAANGEQQVGSAFAAGGHNQPGLMCPGVPSCGCQLGFRQVPIGVNWSQNDSLSGEKLCLILCESLPCSLLDLVSRLAEMRPCLSRFAVHFPVFGRGNFYLANSGCTGLGPRRLSADRTRESISSGRSDPTDGPGLSYLQKPF